MTDLEKLLGKFLDLCPVKLKWYERQVIEDLIREKITNVSCVAHS